MKKRIKNYLIEEEQILEINKDKKEEDYLKLLISDLKKEAEQMPKYSMWSSIVNKCLKEETTLN